MNLPESPPVTQEAQSLAQRFFAQQVLERVVGEKVVFLCDVERVDFTVTAGTTGVVQPPFLHEGRLVAAVLLDNPPEGASDYDNEVHWIEDVNLIDFEDEVSLA